MRDERESLVVYGSLSICNHICYITDSLYGHKQVTKPSKILCSTSNYLTQLLLYIIIQTVSNEIYYTKVFDVVPKIIRKSPPTVFIAEKGEFMLQLITLWA